MKHDDLAAFVPIRFVDAFENDEINRSQFTLGCYLAALCYRAKNTSGGIATVRLAALAELFGASDDTIGRNLHALEPAWIECEVSKGQRAWQIRCTGLHSPAQPPQNFRTTSAPEPPFLRRLTSAEQEPQEEASRHPERDSSTSQPPQNHSGPKDTRPDPTRPLSVEERIGLSRSAVRGRVDVEKPAAAMLCDDGYVEEFESTLPVDFDPVEAARLFDGMYPPKRTRASR